jgi:hypothetical protein
MPAKPRGASPLRAVAGPAPRKRAMTVATAAGRGGRRDLLVALRSRIAKAVEDSATSPRDLAALSRQLLEIVKEIGELDAADGTDDIGTSAATPDEEWAAT